MCIRDSKLFDRFKATDHTDSYWTIYHRLSAATHGNAEETIRWLLGMYPLLDSGDDRLLTKVGIETVNYTAMMLRFAVRFYIESTVHKMCIRDSGCGALYSTVEDLSRWNEGVFNGRVLDAASLKAAFTPVPTKASQLNSGNGYGFGWFVGPYRGLRDISHGGGMSGLSLIHI